MWNETGTFRVEFSRKIRNGPRFKMIWNLFRFVPFFELVWNVSAIPGQNKTKLTTLLFFHFKKWGNQLIESRNLDSIFNLDSTYRIEKSCIYRLSLRIGELDEKAYTPSIMHMYGLFNKIYLFLYFKNILKKFNFFYLF